MADAIAQFAMAAAAFKVSKSVPDVSMGVLSGGVAGAPLTLSLSPELWAKVGQASLPVTKGTDLLDQLRSKYKFSEVAASDVFAFTVATTTANQTISAIEAEQGGWIYVLDAGNDMFTGSNGIELVIAGVGNDRVVGGGGSDVLIGWSGDDELAGGTEDDYLFGDRGMAASCRANSAFHKYRSS